MTAPSPKPWDKPFRIPKGMNWADAMQRLVNDRLPEVEFRAVPIKFDVPVNLVFGHDPSDNNPWRDMEDMASVAGYQLVRKDWVVSFEPAPPIDAGSWKFESDDEESP